MGVKTAGVGHFQIPTAPAAGVSVTSGSANTYTTTPVQLIASTAAALYITGIHVEAAGAKAATYITVQLMVGGSGSETIIGQYLVPLSTASTVALGYRQIYPFIPVPISTRISAKTADSVGAAATLVTLECIAQTNVVDDAIPVSRVTLTDTVTTYTGNTPQTGDTFAVCKSGGTGDNAAIKAKTDNLPAAPASTTNITAGTITTVTNVTNAPTTGDLTAAMKTSVTTAATAATPTVTLANGAHGGAGATLALGGAGGLTATHTGNTTGSVGSVTNGVTLAASQHVIVDSGTVTTLTNLPAITAGWLTATGIAASAMNGKGDWNIGKTGYALTQTFPTNFSAMSLSVGGLVDILQTAADKAWSTTARTLTAGTNIALAKGTGITGFNDIAAGAAMTLTAAYDPAKTAAQAGDAMTLTTAYDPAKTAAMAPDNAGIAAIKLKTDSLAFTSTGKVDANVKAVNDVAITGAGTTLSPWGP